MAESNVIEFENLVQGTSTVGEYAPITAKANAFVAQNAHGVLCNVESYQHVRDLADISAKRTLALLNT